MHSLQQFVPPQQNSSDLQTLVPQHFLPMVAQNGKPFPGQHCFLVRSQPSLPQQNLALVVQNGKLGGVPGQHFFLSGSQPVLPQHWLG